MRVLWTFVDQRAAVLVTATLTRATKASMAAASRLSRLSSPSPEPPRLPTSHESSGQSRLGCVTSALLCPSSFSLSRLFPGTLQSRRAQRSGDRHRHRHLETVRDRLSASKWLRCASGSSEVKNGISRRALSHPQMNIMVKHSSPPAACYIHVVTEAEQHPSRAGAAVHHNGGCSRACPQLPVQQT